MEKKYKGFTLIELLIVIAIIGILASIVLVSLNSARTKANDTAAFTSLRSVVAPLKICLDDEATGRIGWPGSASHGFCVSTSDNTTILGGTGTWPDLEKQGWASTSNGPYPSITRCAIPTTLANATYTDCGSFAEGSCGSGNTPGTFCFFASKPSSTDKILCTEEGCKKNF